MPQQLGELDVLTRTCLVPSTHIGRLKTMWDSSSKGSDILASADTYMHEVYIYTCRYIHVKLN